MENLNISCLSATWNARNAPAVPEVAEGAHVHTKTVYRWIKEGWLEAIHFGPRTYWIPEDVVSQFLHQVELGKLAAIPENNGRRQQ
jgi:excisionase family DNA binding protein